MRGENPHLERGELLFSQRRYDLAEPELRQAIGADPEEPASYAYLALCLAEREQWQEATEAARRAVSLDPGSAYFHYALACVLADRNLTKEARAAIDESLRLEPQDADFWALRARLDLEDGKHRDALEAAERGLEADAEHEMCVNLRAMALTNLGDRERATEAIEATLARNPESATSHANMGRTLLHQGQPRKAMEHFREALRLAPEMEWARAGIVEAMKARNPIYRAFLAYFLLMARLSGRVQWFIIIGGYILFRIIRSAGAANPQLAPLVVPITAAYLTFCIGTVVAYPLFNLLLFLNRFGRHALLPAQRRAAAVFGLFLVPPIVFLVLWAAIGGTKYEIGAMLSGMFTIPVALSGLARGSNRTIMVAVTAALGIIGLVMYALILSNSRAGLGLIAPYVIGCFSSVFLSNALASRHQDRKD
ncbi:MAG: tetratricopeptide repeat protein [Phycisphaerales bacterium]